MSYLDVFIAISILGAVFSFVSSFLNILLIIDMNAWNTQIRLILIMSIYQLIYDPTIYLNALGDQKEDDSFANSVTTANNVLAVIGGFGSNLTSNIILFNVLSILTQRNLKFYNNIYLVNFVTLFPSTVLLILSNSGVTYIENIALYLYYTIRFSSIFLNIFLYIWISFLAQAMVSKNSSLGVVLFSDRALLELVRRLKYYPLVQFLTRVFITCDALANLAPGKRIVDDDPGAMNGFVINFFTVVTRSATSILFFIIFLYTQPSAYRCFISRLTTCKRYIRDISDKSGVANNRGIKGFAIYKVNLFA